MKTFRYYALELTVADLVSRFTFAENAGSLAPAEIPPDAPLIQERLIRPDTADATIRLRVLGDAAARRIAPAAVDPAHRLVQLFLGLAHMKTGAVLRGLDIVDRLDRAGELEIGAAREVLEPDERFNVLAEAMWSPWRTGALPRQHPLRLLAGLDDADDEEVNRRLREWYGRSARWASRVVGFSHQHEHFVHRECGREVSLVEAGDECWLVREHENAVDPNAVKIVHHSGRKLGYLRRTIAEALAPHIDRGAVYHGRVCAFMPRDTPWDERVYVRVEKAA